MLGGIRRVVRRFLFDWRQRPNLIPTTVVPPSKPSLPFLVRLAAVLFIVFLVFSKLKADSVASATLSSLSSAVTVIAQLKGELNSSPVSRFSDWPCPAAAAVAVFSLSATGELSSKVVAEVLEGLGEDVAVLFIQGGESVSLRQELAKTLATSQKKRCVAHKFAVDAESGDLELSALSLAFQDPAKASQPHFFFAVDPAGRIPRGDLLPFVSSISLSLADSQAPESLFLGLAAGWAPSRAQRLAECIQVSDGLPAASENDKNAVYLAARDRLASLPEPMAQAVLALTPKTWSAVQVALKDLEPPGEARGGWLSMWQKAGKSLAGRINKAMAEGLFAATVIDVAVFDPDAAKGAPAYYKVLRASECQKQGQIERD
jgi:hypothetical protein